MRDTLDARDPWDTFEIGDSGAGDVAIVAACALLSGVRIMFNQERNPRDGENTEIQFSRFFDVSSTWHGTALSRGSTSVLTARPSITD